MMNALVVMASVWTVVPAVAMAQPVLAIPMMKTKPMTMMMMMMMMMMAIRMITMANRSDNGSLYDF